MASYGGYDNQGYAQNNYSGGGGYNAGGFMQGSSQGGGGGERKVTTSTLRPVNIEQINNATQPHPDADFKIDDTEIGQLTFVGKVVNISAASTNTTYKIEDAHGTIEVKQWVDPDKATRDNPIKNDMHVRVYGTLKVFSNRRHIGVVSIRPVEDDREIEFHELDVKATSLFFTRGPLNGASHAGNGQMNGAAAGGGSGGAGGPQDELAQKLAPLDPFSRKIMETIHSLPDSNDGVHIRQLQSMLGGGPNLMNAIEGLMSEGHVYSTLDEEHIRSTMLNTH